MLVKLAYYQAGFNPNGFENPFIYSINLLKGNSVTSEYEFPYINVYYLGKQMLSYKAWLNKCYNFKSLSADLLHALKFLSVFEMTHYQICEISGWCSHCTQENINKLFSLGWLNNDENGYYNSFEWWKYFKNLDASEFSEEVSRIIESFSNDSVRGFSSSKSLYLYALAAKNISDGSVKWFKFRNDIANQIRPMNPSLAYEIKRRSGSGLNCLLDYVVEYNKNYKDSSEVKNRNLLDYMDFAVDDSKLESKKLFTKKHLCDKLFNDIVLSKLLHSKINIYRFIKKPNDADNISNLREKLNEETKAFDDLYEYLQKLGKFLLYSYCSCLLEKRPDYRNYSWIGLECITVLIEIAGAGAGNMPLVNNSLMPDNK